MAYCDLTTLADVKAWLQTGQSAFPPTDDGLLTRLITAASQYIQTWLNRRISVGDYLEVRDGTGGQRLQFACFPVSAVLTLAIDGIVIPPALALTPSAGSTTGYAFSSDRTRFAWVSFCAGSSEHCLFLYGGVSGDST